MTDLSEHAKEMAATKPDRFTNAWWSTRWEEVQKGYRGLSHAVNKVLAEYQELRERVEAAEERGQSADVEIGRLQEALEKAREAYAEVLQRCKSCHERSE